MERNKIIQSINELEDKYLNIVIDAIHKALKKQKQDNCKHINVTWRDAGPYDTNYKQCLDCDKTFDRDSDVKSTI